MLNRLLGIIYILMNKGTVTAAELAERFEVSVRTVYRDIDTLAMAGIPVYTRKGKNGGISLTEQFVLNKLLVSQEEQVRIMAALGSLEEVGAVQEKEILQKLGDFFHIEPTSWVAIDFSDWSGRRKELFEQLRQAILEHKLLEFDYYGQYGEMSHRIVEPVQLLFKEYTWYLRAYCRKREAMRLFKVLRMKRVVVLEERFVPEKEKYREEMQQEARKESRQELQQEFRSTEDIENVVQNQNAGRELTEIVFRVDASEAYRIYDRFEEEEITVEEDGTFLIHMKCIIDDWVYGFLLSFGPAIEVIAPCEVKDEIRRRLEKMLLRS